MPWRKISRAFRLEAVRLDRKRGVAVKQATRGFDVEGAPHDCHRRPAKGQGLGGRIQHEIHEAMQRLSVSTEI